MNNNNRGPPGPAQNSDQYALSLLVSAAEGRDSPRQRPGSDPRFGDQAFNLRGLGSGGFGGAEASLEEQILLQQQGFGGGNSGAILNQLREQNLLSQLNQQQQLAALLGFGGGGGGVGVGGSWNPTGPEMRQALAAAQFRQSQASPQLTQADILALSRSGALSGLFGGGDGSGGGATAFGSAASGASAYGSSGAGAFGGSNGADFAGSQAFAAELEGLQRLEELNRRQRLLAASSEAPRPGMDRGLVAQGMVREQQQLSGSPTRNEPSRKIKAETASPQVVSKEDIEKTPGSVIVPCRARGMPMDHNFKTAYFVIPEGVKHGEELICSYFACRNAGIKFRYCSHCKVPVAKRNFRKRHKHGGDITAKGDDSVGEEDIPKKGIPSQITASREEAAEADGISSQSADSTNHQDEKNKVSYVNVQQGLVRNSMITFESNKIKNKSHVEAPMSSKISAERQARWVSLLAKRPSTKDSDTMSTWLMEVLAVSDLATPLKSGDALEDPKASKKRNANDDSPRSDNGYSSSNDDSVTNDDEKKGMLKATDVGIVKKKRPADLLRDELEDANNEKSDAYVSGSFAEWKERKKQRKQSKGVLGLTGVSQQESV